MSDQLECSICFEPLQCADLVELPCRCRVTYCASCWDQSLAHSFNAVGQARCPTCRCPVRADFDADRGRLLFSMETEPHDGCEDDIQVDDDTSDDVETQEEGMDVEADTSGDPPTVRVGEEHRRGQRRRRDSRDAASIATDASARRHMARERLILQARPAQMRILRQYGEANVRLQHAASKYAQVRYPQTAHAQAHCLEEEAAAEALLSQVCAEFALHPPQCVCGGIFERTSAEERIRRALRRQFPHVQHVSRQVDQLVARMVAESISVCSCDLCGRDVRPPEAVWTCERGERTILHANAYDVCERCLCSAGAAIEFPFSRSSQNMAGGAVSSGVMA